MATDQLWYEVTYPACLVTRGKCPCPLFRAPRPSVHRPSSHEKRKVPQAVEAHPTRIW